jgi:integrase/recombinase XerC
VSEAVTPMPEDVIIRPMLTISRAIDLFGGDLARRGYSNRTRATYSRILNKFADQFPADWDVSQVRADDCRTFLDAWNGHAAGTRAHAYSVVSSFFTWLILDERIKRNPLLTVGRPKRVRPEDLDVVTISSAGIRKLLAAGTTWTEKLAVAIPAYIGPRRRAVALLRLRDYDRERRRIRFHEKGGKTIWKPVPHRLVDLIEAAIADGAIVEPDDYLVPPEGTLARKGDRDDRVIWRVVKRVAARAGVDVTVHALRAAFAVFYLEEHPGDVEALKELLGHQSLQTTQTYLRKLDKGAAMERVRDLSWVVDAPVDDGPPDSFDTFVYFIAAGDPDVDGTPIKIGYATEPLSRLANLQGAHHAELRMLAVFPGGLTAEKMLHDELASDRIRGEWFASSPRLRAILDAVKTRMAAGEDAIATRSALLLMGAGGFEPPLGDSSGGERSDTQQSEEDLDEDLLDRTRSAAGEGVRDPS